MSITFKANMCVDRYKFKWVNSDTYLLQYNWMPQAMSSNLREQSPQEYAHKQIIDQEYITQQKVG